jgi:hypothetical protein
MKMLRWAVATASLLLLTACGGGGGDAGAPILGSGGGTGGKATASDLVVELSSAQMFNTASSSVKVTVTAVDSSRNAVAGAPVQITADSDAIVTGAASQTDEAGKTEGTVSMGSNRANRVITVTVTSGSVSKTATIQVMGAHLTGTLAPAVIDPGTQGHIEYRLQDHSGNPMVNQDIQVVASGMTPSQANGKTGPNGEFMFTYTSPATPGSVQVTANAGGASDVQTVQVQATSTVPVVTAPINSASVSANPSVLSVNVPGGTSNRSEIRALFLGANNLPIPNVRVRFDLAGDVNSIGGTFTTGDRLLYSDANGIVTTAYVPGTRFSPTDGVTIRACYGTSDTDPGLVNCTNFATVTLTVTSEALGVSIGTNETIIVNDLTYVKKFIVSVVDSAGVAKPDVNLAVSVDLPQYRKGFFSSTTDGWSKVGGDAAICANEDANRNGVLEAGEDINGTGRLEPGKSDVSVSLLQSKTGPDGTAVLQIQYAKSFGTWVDAKITVAASGVSGTEGRATYVVAPVPVDAASLKKSDSSPAYQVSPYGVAASCTDPN